MTNPTPTQPAEVVPEPAKPASIRLASIDVYRGLVMFLLFGEAFHFCEVARHAPSHQWLWEQLCYHQSHVEWTGCSLHDMIQPSFSFLVGAALPFSLVNRRKKGQSNARTVVHALWRSFMLVFLGVFLRSRHAHQTYFTFEDTLSQIGLGYSFLFLLAHFSKKVQWSALGVIVVGYWAAFALYPAPGPNFDFAAVHVPADWNHHPTGFAAHWDKNSNLAWAFDVWFLNLFPREHPYTANSGGYQTLSFIPTLGTMILGLLAGGELASDRKGLARFARLLAAGVVLFALGWGAGELGVCPVVKRIWTPSWVLYSGGICVATLGVLHLVLDVWGVRFWAFPLRVIGMNSIAAYCMDGLITGFIADNLTIHLGSRIYGVFGAAYVPLVHGALVVLVLWLILFWMYRRKIFLRI